MSDSSSHTEPASHLEPASQPVRLTKFNILDWELDGLENSIIEQESLMHRLLDELVRLTAEEQPHDSNDPSSMCVDSGWYRECGYGYAPGSFDEVIASVQPTTPGINKSVPRQNRIRSQNRKHTSKYHND